jgi:hypothetical protein
MVIGHFDQTSLGLCGATILLNVVAEVSMQDGTMVLTGAAAITTIVYNIQKMLREWRRK